MHPVIYNKLLLTQKERMERLFKTESEGAHTTDSGKLFHSEKEWK